LLSIKFFYVINKTTICVKLKRSRRRVYTPVRNFYRCRELKLHKKGVDFKMKDPRVEQLAELLLNHSTGVEPGDTVLINSTELAQPLVEILYQKVLERGAFPRLKLTFSTLQPLYYRTATEQQLDTLLEIEEMEYKNAQVLINIRAPGNMKELTGIDPARITRRMKALMPVQELIMSGKIRWVLCNYPTNALAQEAELSLDEYEDFVYGATNIDWAEQSRFQDQIKAVFDAGSEVRLEGPSTDLRFSIAGRKGEKCDGRFNMPDGEVFYAPVENSVEGMITYDFPAIFHGREVTGVSLEFKHGVVVKATASKNQDFLEQVLQTDAGARRVGEFGIGVNYAIDRFSKDILFDEKIGGTVHLALGNAYANMGSKNRSAIHWDMIKDLRQGGAIYLDGRKVQENGTFIL
jgi:aminopeptidase